MFSSDTGMIVTKCHFHDCSQVRLAQLLTSETDTIFPKWILNFQIVFCFVLWNDSSLVRFTWEQLYHVPGLGRMITYYILAIDIFCKLVEVLKDQLYQLLRAVLRGKNRSMTLGLGCWILPI